MSFPIQTKLILRATESPFVGPYSDITKNSVLTRAELDGNQIYLKGNIIYAAETIDGFFTLKKLNGDQLQVNITGSTTGYFTTGATLINDVIYFDRNDTLSAYTVNLSSFTASELYTNTAATPTTVGGINAGSTFSAQTIQQMFDALLYPYQLPAFSSFSLGITSPKEIGFDITTGQTFTWSTTNSSNISPNTVQISGYNLITLTGLANDGSEPVSFTGIVTRSATDGPGSRAWVIQATNTHSSTFTSNLSIRWDYKMYAGTSTNTSLTEVQIEALTNFNSVKNGFVGTYAMSAGGYKYFCFADTYGTPNTFVDTATSLNIAMNTTYPNIDINGVSYDLVSVTNVQGETTNYRVYRSLNQLGSTINIALS